MYSGNDTVFWNNGPEKITRTGPDLIIIVSIVTILKVCKTPFIYAFHQSRLTHCPLFIGILFDSLIKWLIQLLLEDLVE